MDIKMINKFLRVALSSLILSYMCLVQSAYAVSIVDVIDPGTVTFNWSATCYDCKADMDTIPEPGMWEGVSGSISLLDYEYGNSFTSMNFSSFFYNGDSDWLPTFSVGGESGEYLYSIGNLDGSLLSDGTFWLSLTATLVSEELAPQNELLSADDENVPSMDAAPGAPGNIRLNIETSGLWSISTLFLVPNLDDDCRFNINQANCDLLILQPPMEECYEGEDCLATMDKGEGFLLAGFTTRQDKDDTVVPAPSTLAIFALGLMGLGLRRIKKQS
jgi:hypothetical protein